MSTRRKARRLHADDLRGATRMVIEATKRVTDVVQEMHVTIASGPELLGRPLEGPARAITGIVYGSIRGVTHVVGAGLDVVLDQLAPLLGESAPGSERAAFVAALNGVIGDYLSESGNPLATPIALCYAGEPLVLDPAGVASAFPRATGKVLVLAHGSSMNDQQWRRGGHDHGQALARDLDYTPVYLRYNSGLHVSTNGEGFAELLEQLVKAWPVPVESIAIVGHSMGGLVARSACHVAETKGQAWAWRKKLAKIASIGTPHHGAPLERLGNTFEALLGVSRYSAPLAALSKLRSAGVTDLRYGNVLEEHWNGRDRFAFGADPRRRLALPEGVSCYAVAGSLSLKPGQRPRGDGLVPVDSALGRHKRDELSLALPEAHQLVAYGVDHLGLLSRAEVYAQLRAWLAA